MPITPAGMKVLASMRKSYGPDKGKSVFYASQNKGIPGSDKWEGNPDLSSPPGEHIAAIHAHMENIGNSLNAIADKVGMLKQIRTKQINMTPNRKGMIDVPERIADLTRLRK